MPTNTAFETFKYIINDKGVAVISMDIPGSSANVMSDAFRDELSLVIDKVVADDSVIGAVITSSKNDFMAGGDLKAMVEMFAPPITKEQALDLANALKPTLRKLETCGKPFVAAINGAAMGGGLELALACHYRVVADNNKLFLGLPEVTLGLMPGAGGSQRLPRMIGIAPALEIMLQGAPLTPEKALKKGIVDAVIPADQLLDTVCEKILNGEVSAVKGWDEKGFKIPGGSGFFDADLGNLYNYHTTTIANNTQRNLPAPIALLTAVARGTAVEMDQGLHIESCQFAKLILDPTARNMVRTMFVNKGELDKLVRRPQGIDKADLKTIGVLGAGLMGAGIALSSAQAGLTVKLLDLDQSNADKGKAGIAKGFEKRISRGRMTQDKAYAILERITPTNDYSQLADCDIVVEAVFEDENVKKKVFAMARESMREDAILASNTSTLPITGLSENLADSSRFIGLHFFSPVDRMPLVEVIVGKDTSDETLAHSLDLVGKMRKTPIVVNDSRGFYTSRVISAYLQEAFSMVGDGLSPTLIDNVAKQAGFAMGPLALIDDIGMENGYKATLAEKAAVGDTWQEPQGFHVQKTLHDSGRIGRRAAQGFYDYATVDGVDNQRQEWAGIGEVFTPAAKAADAEELKQRLLYIQALEAAKCMEENVITDVTEGDVGVILGIGFPGYTGGVFSLMDTVGLKEFVNRCDQLADTVGERFRPSEWLRQRAENNQAFY
ncbi:MAG: 3-hydroxyacyl-CoA dehydrogenase [Cellvibrionaceae bacterium]|nr:3-hydroxyacyl-CoA dehydrogenase [Cellvibrionaceae bacterium]|tara:strand:- start:14690 stop:16858 length:2169 start_codon:yes stop_codon:yes gene_type:complete